MSLSLILLLLLNFYFATSYRIETKFGAKHKAYCPKNHFVSDLTVHKGQTKQGDYDVRFSITCDKFVKGRKKDNDNEHCVTKFRFGIPDNELLLDDHWKSCTCDEYLAGMKTYYHKTRTGGRRHDFRVQWRCCYGFNKVMNLSTCYYTGLRYLRAPWKTELKTRKWKWPREVIQSLTISQNYVNARVCKWLIKGRDVASKNVKHFWNKCEGVKKIGIKEIYDKIKAWSEGECIIPTGMAPFGWGESTNSLATENSITYKEKRLYRKQQHMCRDGNYIYGLYKYAINGPKGKDYVFLTKCHEITYTVCQCMWKENCTKPEDRLNKSDTNTTYYVAGWRSKWSKERARREVEVFCCKSKGLNMVYCNVTKNFTDKDTRIVINRPRYKFDAFLEPEVIDGEIIRDIDQWHINGSFIVRFNICRVNGSDGVCEEKCYDCTDIDPTGGICTSPKTTTSTSTASTESTATTSTSTASTTTTTTTAADPLFDFAFLFDESGSLKQEGFDIEQSFLVEFVKQFQIDPGITRTTLIRFSDSAAVEWDFDSFPDQSTDSVVQRIEAFTYPAGRTDITGSLEQSIPIFQTQARPNVNRVVFLLTDGRHNQGGDAPSVPAAVLRNSGIQIFAIAINGPSGGIDIVELEQITGDPAKVYVTDFASLVGNAAEIKQLIVDNAIIR